MPTARGEHPGADVADAGHLEQPLDGAVLAPRAVQQREDDVDLAEGLRRLRRLVHDEVGGAPRRAARAIAARSPSTSGSLSGPVIRSRSGSPDSSTQRPSVAMPTGTTSYAVAVDGLRARCRRSTQRDGVLAGAAAEDDGDAGLAGLARWWARSSVRRPYRPGRAARLRSGMSRAPHAPVAPSRDHRRHGRPSAARRRTSR